MLTKDTESGSKPSSPVLEGTVLPQRVQREPLSPLKNRVVNLQINLQVKLQICKSTDTVGYKKKRNFNIEIFKVIG